jgi:hypothetical protein
MNDSVLKWKEDSIIAEAFVSKDASGKNYAILKANEKHFDKVANLQEQLYQDRNIESYPKIINGEPCLVVKKFHAIEDLKSALQSVGATEGSPDVDNIKGKDKNLGEMWEEFRRNEAMHFGGLAGLAGHGFMAFRGKREQDSTKMIMSLLYMINSGLYFAFGNGDRGLQIDAVLDDVNIMLKQSGVDLQKTSLEELIDKYEKDKPLAEKLRNFVSDNVVFINEGIIGLTCNAGMIKSGIENRQIGIFTSGVTAALGSLISLIKEKPKSEQSPEMLATIPGKIIAELQNAPSFWNGISNWLNSSALATDVIGIYDAVENSKVAAKMPNNTGEYVKGKYDINEVINHYQGKFNQGKIDLGNIADQFETDDYKQQQKDLEKTQADLNHAKRHARFHDEGAIAYQTTAAMSACYVAATFFQTVAYKNKAVSSDPYERYEALLVRAAQKAMQVPEGKERDEAVYLMSAGLASNREVKGLNTDQINAHLRKEIKDLEINHFNSVGRNNIVKIKNPEPLITTDKAILEQKKLEEFAIVR